METVMSRGSARCLAVWLALALRGWAADATSVAQADALLQAAQANIAAARAKLAEADPVTNAPLVSGPVDLSTFAWTSGGGIRDPAGWPYARRSEVTPAYGRLNLQWYEKKPQRGGGILHAMWPAGSESASGATATWYYFSPGTAVANPPDPRLAAYRWTQMGGPSTDASGTWIKWRKAP